MTVVWFGAATFVSVLMRAPWSNGTQPNGELLVASGGFSELSARLAAARAWEGPVGPTGSSGGSLSTSATGVSIIVVQHGVCGAERLDQNRVRHVSRTEMYLPFQPPDRGKRGKDNLARVCIT